MRRVLLAVTVVTALGGCSPILYAIMRLRTGGGGNGVLVVGVPVQGSTEQGDDAFSPRCGGRHSASGRSYTFVPRASGRYRFDLTGSYDCVVAVYRGTEEIACNDDFESLRHSRVEIELEAGERYTVVVDGYQAARGDYSLTVDPLASVATSSSGFTPPAAAPESAASMGPRCENAVALRPGTTTGTISPALATARTVCGATGPGGDMVYRFDTNEAGTLAVRATQAFDGVLELRQGCFGGRVVMCNDDYGDTRHSMVSAHVDPGAYFLIADAYTPAAAGGFVLEVEFHADQVAASGGEAPTPAAAGADMDGGAAPAAQSMDAAVAAAPDDAATDAPAADARRRATPRRDR